MKSLFWLTKNWSNVWSLCKKEVAEKSNSSFRKSKYLFVRADPYFDHGIIQCVNEFVYHRTYKNGYGDVYYTWISTHLQIYLITPHCSAQAIPHSTVANTGFSFLEWTYPLASSFCSTFTDICHTFELSTYLDLASDPSVYFAFSWFAFFKTVRILQNFKVFLKFACLFSLSYRSLRLLVWATFASHRGQCCSSFCVSIYTLVFSFMTFYCIKIEWMNYLDLIVHCRKSIDSVNPPASKTVEIIDWVESIRGPRVI